MDTIHRKIKAKADKERAEFIKNYGPDVLKNLNGKELQRPFIDHKDIVSGGELILEMSDVPNREWGIE